MEEQLIIRAKMELKDFFSLKSKLISSTFKVSPLGLKTGDDIHLTEGNYNEIKFPIIFKHESGKKLTDILDTGYVSLFLISDRIKNILEKYNLTGWKVYPIQIYDKKEERILGYHGFSIIGTCGEINFQKSEIFEKRLVPTGPLCKFYKGLHIGLDRWNGMDFFIPEKTLRIIITKKTAEILNREKITNMNLDNLQDYEALVKAVS